MSGKRFVTIKLAEVDAKSNPKDAKKRIELNFHPPLKKKGDFGVLYKTIGGKGDKRKGRYEVSGKSVIFRFFSGDGEEDVQKVELTCFDFNGESQKGIGLYETSTKILPIDWQRSDGSAFG